MMTGEPYRRAYSGRRIYVRDPSLNPAIHLTDIAHALARIVRFNGHTRHRYSVASHCLMVADLVGAKDPSLRVSGLMHDALEAVLGDVSSPVKSILPDYKALEALWEGAMSIRWGVALHGPTIKAADRLAYALERRALAPYDLEAGSWDPEMDVDIPPSAPPIAKYVGSPASIASWWLSEARRLGVPRVA
jgi:hypothetical protein